MRFALWGLVLAALIFLVSGGHVLFLPLFFVLPLGGYWATDGGTAAGGSGTRPKGAGAPILADSAPAGETRSQD